MDGLDAWSYDDVPLFGDVWQTPDSNITVVAPVGNDYGGIDVNRNYTPGNYGSSGIIGSALDLAKSVSSTVFGVQQAGVDIQRQQNAVELAKLNTAANQKIALQQSAWAQRMGVAMPTDATTLYNSSGISQAISNIQRGILQTTSSSSGLMMLAIVGAAIFFMAKK